MIAKLHATTIYKAWLSHIVETHLRKQWNSPVDEPCEEWMNERWEELSEVEQQRLWGLSSDLNSLRDQETWVETADEQTTQESLAREQSAAFQARDWDRLLTALRQPPRFHTRDMIDCMRARAWLEMGQPEIAALFFDNATRLNPNDGTYPALALECLKRIPDWVEAAERAEKYIEKPGMPPRLLFRAADVLFVYGDQIGDARLLQRAIDAVDKGFAVFRASALPENHESILAGAYATKAFSLQRIDRTDDALVVLENGVRRLPKSIELLTARGLAKQQLGRPDAIDDFKRAVEQGSALVWPYLELGRTSLMSANYQEAINHCRRGLACTPTDSVAATLFQYMAIALYHRGDARESVNEAFQEAAQLDPFSREIQVNRELFEAGRNANSRSVPTWQIPSTALSTAIHDILGHLFAVAA